MRRPGRPGPAIASTASDGSDFETDGPADFAVAPAAARPRAHCGPGRRQCEDRSSRLDAPRPGPFAPPASPPSRRYEKSRPGELLHVDIKMLPALRNARYDYEFAAVDDFSREAVVTITTEQTSAAATTFLEQVVGRLPYRVEAVLTDNALAFRMKHD